MGRNKNISRPAIQNAPYKTHQKTREKIPGFDNLAKIAILAINGEK